MAKIQLSTAQLLVIVVAAEHDKNCHLIDAVGHEHEIWRGNWLGCSFVSMIILLSPFLLQDALL